jgi:antibiotic biosynthesis monooxygenase (ABM) superfamily enzyme
MDVSSSDTPGPRLEVRSTRASAVIVQRVPVDKVERFLELQRGIVQAAQGFPGYQKVDIYPPARHEQVEWVVVLHFDHQEALQRWLDAPVRAEWIARFHNEIGESRLKPVPAGFNAWFTGLVPEGGLPPPWKVALVVLLPLYPTITLLSLVLPGPDKVGQALSILLSNLCSVCILQWVLSPPLNRLLAPWLRANGRENGRFTLLGLVLIVAILGVLLIVFHLIRS